MAQAGDPVCLGRKRVPVIRLHYDSRSKNHGCNETGRGCCGFCMLAARRTTSFIGGLPEVRREQQLGLSPIDSCGSLLRLDPRKPLTTTRGWSAGTRAKVIGTIGIRPR